MADREAWERVTRFEVIDHRYRTHDGERGRVFVANPAKVTLSYQDNGRTLKVFVDDLTSGGGQ